MPPGRRNDTSSRPCLKASRCRRAVQFSLLAAAAASFTPAVAARPELFKQSMAFAVDSAFPAPDRASHGGLDFYSGRFLALVVIVVTCGMHGYVYFRDKPGLLIVVVYVLYVALHTCSSTMQVLVGRESVDTMGTAQAIVFAGQFMKLVASAISTGCEIASTPTPYATQATPSANQLSLFWRAGVCALMPSMFYTASDIMLIFCQQNMSMTEVQVLSKLSIPLAAVVWWLVFKVGINKNKIIGLFVITFGTIVYAYGQQTHLGQSISKASPVPLWMGLAAVPLLWVYRGLMVVYGLLNNCGSVSNEYFLLECPASVNMQNCAMYLWGMSLVIIYGVAGGTGLPFHRFANFGVVEWTAALVFGAVGICTSHFLKKLGTIWKQVAYGAMLLCYNGVDNVFLGNYYAPLANCGVIIVGAGTCLFIIDGVEERRVKLQEAEAIPYDTKPSLIKH